MEYTLSAAASTYPPIVFMVAMICLFEIGESHFIIIDQVQRPDTAAGSASTT